MENYLRRHEMAYWYSSQSYTAVVLLILYKTFKAVADSDILKANFPWKTG